MKNIKIIITFILLGLIIISLVLKSNLFGCDSCIKNSKSFITEVKNIVQIAIIKHKSDKATIYCKDSNNDDPLEVKIRNDIFYYIEFNDNNVVKLMAFDTKNKLYIMKESINGISINEISDKDYSNTYDLSHFRCD